MFTVLNIYQNLNWNLFQEIGFGFLQVFLGGNFLFRNFDELTDHFVLVITFPPARYIRFSFSSNSIYPVNRFCFQFKLSLLFFVLGQFDLSVTVVWYLFQRNLMSKHSSLQEKKKHFLPFFHFCPFIRTYTNNLVLNFQQVQKKNEHETEFCQKEIVDASKAKELFFTLQRFLFRSKIPRKKMTTTRINIRTFFLLYKSNLTNTFFTGHFILSF